MGCDEGALLVFSPRPSLSTSWPDVIEPTVPALLSRAFRPQVRRDFSPSSLAELPHESLNLLFLLLAPRLSGRLPERVRDPLPLVQARCSLVRALVLAYRAAKRRKATKKKNGFHHHCNTEEEEEIILFIN